MQVNPLTIIICILDTHPAHVVCYGGPWPNISILNSNYRKLFQDYIITY